MFAAFDAAFVAAVVVESLPPEDAAGTLLAAATCEMPTKQMLTATASRSRKPTRYKIIVIDSRHRYKLCATK